MRKASQQEGFCSRTGRVHMTAETPTAVEAKVLMSAVRVVSGCFPLKRRTLPERVAPKGNQQSLMAKRTGLPPWTVPIMNKKLFF